MSKYTRRHYKDVADLFYRTLPAKSGPEENQWIKMRSEFVELFEKDNPSFRTLTFIEATISRSGNYHLPLKK